MKSRTELSGAFSLLTAALIYALFNVLIREMAKMYGDQAQVAVRFFAALILLLLIHLYQRKVPFVAKDRIKDVVKLSLTMATLVLLITISVNNTKIANTVFLIYAGSISGAFLLGTFVLKESVTKQKLMSIALALIGLSFFLVESRAFDIGLVTAFAAGLLDSVVNTYRKKLKGVNRNSLLVYQYSIMTVFTIFMTFALGGDIIRNVTTWGIFVTLLYAVLLVTLGNLLLYGFQHFDVNVGTVILASELFFALVMGILLFNENPTMLELLGGITIFAATVFTVIGIGNNARKTRAQNKHNP